MIKGDLATDAVDFRGDRFSEEAMRQIAEKCVGLPISINFDSMAPPIGKIIKSNLIDGRVEVEVELTDSFSRSIDKIELFLSTACAILEEERIDIENRLLKDIYLVEASLIPGRFDSKQRPLHYVPDNDTIE